MLELLQAELRKMRLGSNWSKTKKRLTNCILRLNHNDISFTSIGEHFVEIMRSSDSRRICGRDMNLIQQRAQIDVDHKLKVAWESFHKYRRALVNRNVSFKLRLRLSVLLLPQCISVE